MTKPEFEKIVKANICGDGYNAEARTKRILDAHIVCMNKWKSTKQKDKYRWHDLREDPNDLPKIDEMVIVCFQWKGKFSGDIYREYTTTYHNGITFDGFIVDDLNEIIAWKEIEPFEVEE